MSEQKSALSVKVEVDTKEANENIKELTAAVNDCVEAFEKLEKVIGKFKNQNETVELYCDGKVIAQTIIQRVKEIDRFKETF
ncbi:hypothetical protein COL32_27650 [Bacillus pseudomycoides]|uniref:hypothetical protein n=1 Tax=Bacillus pseudomycoides TaxID=64104 RepID=UPI000BF5D161|nr:hypothetical protein [Bacillus pseudomycoides]PFW87235.1 hypothetical protein COL29_29775 [Bacillus pseudomycoides]PFX37065.1 hypothetical protein COL32_27650 [Bacillus pseudomycoides]